MQINSTFFTKASTDVVSWMSHLLGVLKGDTAPGTATVPNNYREDAGALIIMSLAMLFLVRFLQWGPFSIFAKYVLGLRDKETILKAAEGMREFCYTSISLALSARCFLGMQWAQIWGPYENVEAILSGCVGYPSENGSSPAVLSLDSATGCLGATVEARFLTHLEAAWYLSGIISLLLDAKKSDFVVYMIHHFTTLSLLVLSYLSYHYKAAVVVYTLHNISDPFLHGAKLFKYAGSETMATIIFVMFMIVFFVTRLVLYPRFIMCMALSTFDKWIGAYYFPLFTGNTPASAGTDIAGQFYIHQACCYLLTVLVLVHVYWFYLILLIAKDAVFGEINDIREEPAKGSTATTKSNRKRGRKEKKKDK